MIIRGGGAMGAAGFTGAGACICITLLCAGVSAAGGTPPVGVAGVVTRGGTAIAGEVVTGAGVVAAGGATGALGGITTTDGGLYVAATEAGVTILGAGGAGASVAGLGGIAFGATGAAGASAFASIAGGAAGGRTTGRATGCSAASFCCVRARRTSPGREMCERSILVLNSSSP
jgi:hypothetical protein